MKTIKCLNCGETKAATKEQFHINRARKSGFSCWCKDCFNLHNRQRYKDNHVKIRKRRNERNRIKKRQMRLKVYKHLLSHPCSKCGEGDPVVLEFNHLKNKKYNVADMLSGTFCWDTIKKEIDKCEILCSNCHRRETAKQQNWHQIVKQEIEEEYG